MNITFAVLTRNRAGAVLRCVESLRVQLSDGDELLVLVNGTEDDTTARLVAAVPQARVVETSRNLGCPGGRNRLAQLAKTEWIVYIDDDGEVPPGFVALARRSIQEHPGAAVIAGCAIDAVHPDPDTLSPGPVGNFSGGICVLRRSLFLELGGYPEEGVRQGEEIEYAIKLLRQGGTIWRDPALRLLHHADNSLPKLREVIREGLRGSLLTGLRFCPLYALLPWLFWKTFSYCRWGMRMRDFRPVAHGLRDAMRHSGAALRSREPVRLSVLVQASTGIVTTGGRWSVLQHVRMRSESL